MILGFVFFVASLQAGHYRFQFTQFAWTHMALYLIVVQAHFIMNNVFEGMIWFFLPVSLVICNDIFAYLCGITFGRTQLIKLSPKKTVEGFVGAWILTVIFGVGMTNVLMRYDYFICPVNVSGSSCFDYELLTDLDTRTLAQTSGQVCIALLIPFSCHTPTTSQYGSPSRVPTRSHLCNSTFLYSLPSPLLSHPLAASSHLASSGPSRSRISATPFPVMVVSRTAWTASSSWDSSHTCTIIVSLLCIRSPWVE